MRKAILAGFLALFSAVSARAQTKPAEIVKGDDGKLIIMSQKDAVDYCARKGEHLPSAREFAAYAATIGANKIKEPDPSLKDIPADAPAVASERDMYASFRYFPINRLNAHGDVVVDFYFSDAGFGYDSNWSYKKPFWTSSPSPGHWNLAYFFQDGIIGETSSPDGFGLAVSCFEGPSEQAASQPLKTSYDPGSQTAFGCRPQVCTLNPCSSDEHCAWGSTFGAYQQYYCCPGSH